MSKHDAVEVIIAKRDGAELSDSQIDWVIDAYTNGVVADEQCVATIAGLPAQNDRRDLARTERDRAQVERAIEGVVEARFGR